MKVVILVNKNRGKECSQPLSRVDVNKWLSLNLERGKNNIPLNVSSDCPRWESTESL
jgi:hypothetical protein